MLPGAAAMGPISPIPRSRQPPAPHSPFVSARQKHSLFRDRSPDKWRFVSWEELAGLGRGSTICAWEAPLQGQPGLSWHRAGQETLGGGGEGGDGGRAAPGTVAPGPLGVTAEASYTPLGPATR